MATSIVQKTVRTAPGRGDIVPVLRGQTPGGAAISTRDYYMRRNLAILFASDDERGRAWIDEGARAAEAAAAHLGQVVIVAPGTVDTSDLPTLVDTDGSLRAQFGLDAAELPALFVVDRYGTLFAGTHGAGAESDLRPNDIPRWLEFIACRCS